MASISAPIPSQHYLTTKESMESHITKGLRLLTLRAWCVVRDRRNSQDPLRENGSLVVSHSEIAMTRGFVVVPVVGKNGKVENRQYFFRTVQSAIR
jgi:hypothetical protein